MILLKSPEELSVMRKASRIVAEILVELRKTVASGMTTDELDALAERLTLEAGARPAFKGYRPRGVTYPKTLCVSINEEIVHGIPSGRKIKSGDIVSLDFGVVYDGFFGDAAVTVAVGKVSNRALKLMEVTRNSLYAAIEQARVGNRMSDISCAVQKTAESAGFSVVRGFRRPRNWAQPARGPAGAELLCAGDAQSAAAGRDGAGDRADGERRHPAA